MIIGNFYFKRTSSGNLLGEYTNTVNEMVFTETATPNNDKNSTFEGTYFSNWIEGNKGDTHKSKLIIKSEGKKFKLIWGNNEGDFQFYGQGFVFDGILIGFYVDKEGYDRLKINL